MGAVNRLAKWRSVFTAWQLGTRADTDPEAQAVRDHRELTILMRAEVNALVALLVEKGITTTEEFTKQVETEAEFLEEAYRKRFPGFRSNDYGMDVNVALAVDTTRGWKP